MTPIRCLISSRLEAVREAAIAHGGGIVIVGGVPVDSHALDSSPLAAAPATPTGQIETRSLHIRNATVHVDHNCSRFLFRLIEALHKTIVVHDRTT